MSAHTVRRSGRLLALSAGFLILLSLSSSSNFPTGNRTAAPDDAPSPQEEIAHSRGRGRVMQALYRVEALAGETGWTPELQRAAGELWREAGDLSAAAAYWQAAAGARTVSPAFLRELAQLYITLQRWTEAADTLERLLESDPGNHWAHYQLGLIRLTFDPRAAQVNLSEAAASPVYRAAANELLQGLQDTPTGPMLGLRAGLALADYELWPQAELAFSHALTAGEESAELLAYTAIAREQQGKDGRAWIERAIALDPGRPQAHYAQGLALRRRGDLAGSLAAFIQAVALDPENPALSAELAEAYRSLGDLEQAERWFRLAASLSDHAPRFEYLLALFYADEGYRLEGGGLEALLQINARQPDNPDINAGLGWSLYLQGESERGLAALDAALMVDPGNARALFYKGRILLETDRVEEAIPLLGRAAEVDSPFQEEARRILAQAVRDI